MKPHVLSIDCGTQSLRALIFSPSGDLVLSEKLALSAGFRHDRADFEFSPSTPDKIDMNEDLFTVGLNYSLADDIQVYGSYSQSFRYPLFDEIFSFFTNTVSTSLIPQTSDDYEVGLRYAVNNSFFATINIFRIDIIIFRLCPRIKCSKIWHCINTCSGNPLPVTIIACYIIIY